jgi:hypothetical protein
MCRTIVVPAILAVWVLGFASSADAQVRKGPWLDVGGGLSSVGGSADGRAGLREGSGAGGLRGGWGVHPQLLVGLEVHTAVVDPGAEIPGLLDLFGVEATLVYYPRDL